MEVTLHLVKLIFWLPCEDGSLKRGFGTQHLKGCCLLLGAVHVLYVKGNVVPVVSIVF